MQLYAFSATERGIRARQLARASMSCAALVETVSEPAPPPEPEPEPEPIAEPEPTGYVPPVRAIITKIAEKHGLSYRDVVGPSRYRNIVAARREAMSEVCRQKPALSLCQIGKFFGNRDHTTVFNSLRKAGQCSA